MEYPKVKLVKVASTHNNVRTPEAEGVSPTWPPVKGQKFLLFGEGLEIPGSTRVIETTPVKEIVAIAQSVPKGQPVPEEYEVKTENSTYRLVRID
jgi:hypothetical protein